MCVHMLRVRSVEKILNLVSWYIHLIVLNQPWKIQVYIENIHNTGQENYKYTKEINQWHNFPQPQLQNIYIFKIPMI